jgi:hypothetical protein
MTKYRIVKKQWYNDVQRTFSDRYAIQQEIHETFFFVIKRTEWVTLTNMDWETSLAMLKKKFDDKVEKIAGNLKASNALEVIEEFEHEIDVVKETSQRHRYMY